MPCSVVFGIFAGLTNCQLCFREILVLQFQAYLFSFKDFLLQVLEGLCSYWSAGLCWDVKRIGFALKYKRKSSFRSSWPALRLWVNWLNPFTSTVKSSLYLLIILVLLLLIADLNRIHHCHFHWLYIQEILVQSFEQFSTVLRLVF